MDEMNAVPVDPLSDRNHWLINLRGPVSGAEETRAYHLAAPTETAARHGALRKWGSEFDGLPLVTFCDRYYDWRAWESESEGRQGVRSEGVTL